MLSTRAEPGGCSLFPRSVGRVWRSGKVAVNAIRSVEVKTTRRSVVSQTLDVPTSAIPVSSAAEAPTRLGLRVPRRWTQPGQNPLDQVVWEKRRTVISNPDGSVVFKMEDVEVPAAWSQLATDIVVSKYFRKAGLPGSPGHETSVRQVVHRLAHTIRVAGEGQGSTFASADD